MATEMALSPSTFVKEIYLNSQIIADDSPGGLFAEFG